MRSRLVSETRSRSTPKIKSPFGFLRARNSSADSAVPSFWRVILTPPDLVCGLALVSGIVPHSNIQYRTSDGASPPESNRSTMRKEWQCDRRHFPPQGPLDIARDRSAYCLTWL